MSKRTKKIKGMPEKERLAELKQLKMELVKSSLKNQKNSHKTKDIKRDIARILTFNQAEKASRLKKN